VAVSPLKKQTNLVPVIERRKVAANQIAVLGAGAWVESIRSFPRRRIDERACTVSKGAGETSGGEPAI
jgi:hypothetical protein